MIDVSIISLPLFIQLFFVPKKEEKRIKEKEKEKRKEREVLISYIKSVF